MEQLPIVSLGLLETFLEFGGLAGLQTCFLCSKSEKIFTSTPGNDFTA